MATTGSLQIVRSVKKRVGKQTKNKYELDE